MFIRRRLKKRTVATKHGAQAEAQVGDTPPLEPKEPEIVSNDSSEVEYIEDDPGYQKKGRVDGAENNKHHRAQKQQQETVNNEFSLSMVLIPLTAAHVDDDSCFSEDKVVKAPSHLTKKVDASSITSGHGTEVTASATLSESGSASIASSRNESRKARQLAIWRRTMEKEMGGFEGAKKVNCLLELGSMYMEREHFEEAKGYFGVALAISERVFDDHDLRLAKALELYGIAEYSGSICPKEMVIRLGSALKHLDRALRIRYDQLGATHVDTVETLNKIARIQARQRNYAEARDSYYEVLKLREAIFGHHHPCIAVTAQALASIHTRLFQMKASQLYFNLALKVYEYNDLGNHELAKGIRKDLEDLKYMNSRFEV